MVPTQVFRQIPLTTTVAALDSEAKRLAAIGSESSVNHGSPPSADSPLDFGQVDISGGADASDVAQAVWHISADDGNTAAEGFKLWLLAADNGFTGTTTVEFETQSGNDPGPGSLTEDYVINAVDTTYTGNAMPATEPAQNLFPSDEASSMVLSTTSDDALLFCIWINVGGDEATGTYEAADSGNELRFSFEYAYS